MICTNSSTATDTKPTAYIPAPTAMPTAEVTQMPAAVVSPLMDSPLTKIMPAPRKEMPVMILAAIREASKEMPSCVTTS